MTTPDNGAAGKTPADAQTEPAVPGPDASPSEIEEKIERTRSDLGANVDELASRLDVKSQAKDQVDQAKERAAEQWNEAKEQTLQSAEKARDFVTDDHGRPNRNGWIALLGAAGLIVAIIALSRRGR